MFVSVLDARKPTSQDNDFYSDNFGADEIKINSNNQIFLRNGYNTSNGVIFVVGVKALTSNVTYSIIMSGPTPYS